MNKALVFFFTVILIVLAILLISEFAIGINPTVFAHASSKVPNYENFPEPRVVYEVLPPLALLKPHIVITGGAGFIGSQLGWYFHNKGYEVTLIDNMAFGYDDNLIVDGNRFGRFVIGDVNDPRIFRFFKNVDAVYHFAALSALPVCQSHPKDTMYVNVGGVANILEAARLHGVRRFIFASTSAVYENNKEEIFTEDLPVEPHLLYSLSKYQSELLCKGMSAVYKLDVVIMRFFNVYGPHQDFRRKSPPFTSYVVRELLNNRTPVLHSDGKQKRDYVYISDLIDLAERVLVNPNATGQIFNVASGKAYSVLDIYNIIAAAVGSKIQPTFRSAERFWDAYPELFEGSKPIDKNILIREVNKYTTGSYKKGQELLGWVPKVSMEQGLKEMVEYVKKNQRDQVQGNFVSAWGKK